MRLMAGSMSTGLTGYSRMIGDGADNPYTALRGSPNQFLVGLGLGYTF